MKADLISNVSKEIRDKYTIGFIMKLRAVGRLTLARSASGYIPHDWEKTFRKELIRLFDWLPLKNYMFKVTEIKITESHPTYNRGVEKLTEDFFAMLLKSNAAVRKHRALVADIFEDWKRGCKGPFWKRENARGLRPPL